MNDSGHYVTEKDGTRVWVGPSRGEVAYYRDRLVQARAALLAVAAISTQGSVCEIAAQAIERTK